MEQEELLLSEAESARLRRIDAETLWHPFTQMQGHADEDPPPPIIVGAEGNRLIAADGKRYFDANSGYWCLALGVRPQAVEEAVARQLRRFSHSTLLGLTHRPVLELSERLTRLAGDPFNHVFYADSGSEAVEVALKMAYHYQVHRGRPERSRFLALGEAYHGDTVGAVAVGGVDLFHGVYRPLLFSVERVKPPHCRRCAWGRQRESCALECAAEFVAKIEAHKHELAAVIIEPLLLGAGGILPQPEGWARRVTEAARAAGVLTIFDEVAVGIGRLGTLFAFEQVGVKPDFVCLAKGLTAGLLPMSAVLTTGEVFQAFLGSFAERKTFFHGHTFTGSALGCAAALAVLDELTPEFLAKLREETVPAFWRALEPLAELPRVAEVRGRGMMAGVELVKDKERDESFPRAERRGHRAVLALRRRGVQTRAIGDLLLCAPPLTTTPEEIELLAETYPAAVREATAG